MDNKHQTPRVSVEKNESDTSHYSRLKQISYFAKIKADEQDLHDLASRLYLENHNKGNLIYAVGDLADKIFIVFKGLVCQQKPNPSPKSHSKKVRKMRDPVKSLSMKDGNQYLQHRQKQENKMKSDLFLTSAHHSNSNLTSNQEYWESREHHSSNKIKKQDIELIQEEDDDSQSISQQNYDEDNANSNEGIQINANSYDPYDYFNRNPKIDIGMSKTRINDPKNQMNVSNYSTNFPNQMDNSINFGEGEVFGHDDILNERVTVTRQSEIICLQDSLIGVITKNSYQKLLGNIERRTTNEKINILQKIAAFSKLTRNTLAKLSQNLITKVTPKDCILYKEGDPADMVYIIQSGEFQVFRKIKSKQKTEEDVKEIRDNPNKARKSQNKFFKNGKQSNEQIFPLYFAGHQNLLGDEDIVQPYLLAQFTKNSQDLLQKRKQEASLNQCSDIFYSTTAKCVSQTAQVLCMKQEDFLKLQQHNQAWKQLLQDCELKLRKVQNTLMTIVKTNHSFKNKKSQDDEKIDQKFTDYTSADNYLSSKVKIQQFRRKQMKLSSDNIESKEFKLNNYNQETNTKYVSQQNSPIRETSILKMLPSIKTLPKHQNQFDNVSQQQQGFGIQMSNEQTKVKVLKNRIYSQQSSPFRLVNMKRATSTLANQYEDKVMNTAYTLKPNSKLQYYKLLDRDKSHFTNLKISLSLKTPKPLAAGQKQFSFNLGHQNSNQYSSFSKQNQDLSTLNFDQNYVNNKVQISNQGSPQIKVKFQQQANLSKSFYQRPIDHQSIVNPASSDYFSQNQPTFDKSFQRQNKNRISQTLYNNQQSYGNFNLNENSIQKEQQYTTLDSSRLN
eukprot:403339902